METAVISDMHGNCVAFDAVLADLKRKTVEQIVCLGDAIQGGPQPAQAVGRLRDLACPVVMGNADAWLLTGQEFCRVPFDVAELVRVYHASGRPYAADAVAQYAARP